MFLSITSTWQPATDLGYLLGKNPARAQTFEQGFGSVHVFWAEASTERATAVLALDIDAVDLVRRSKNDRAGPGSFPLQQYVNDRPYVASSFLSVAIAQVYRSALAGKCKERPELVEQAMPLVAKMPALPCRGGTPFLRGLFKPLGYEISAERLPLDPRQADWGESRYYSVTLSAEICLRDLVRHLYVLIPVLDDDKHYWVGQQEVDKLLEKGKGWLGDHPLRDQIVDRYLKRQKSLKQDALARLATADGETQVREEDQNEEEARVERKIRLNDVRLSNVADRVRESGARSVVDLGCGEGKLLRLFLANRKLSEIVGLDVSHRALELASRRLRLETASEHVRKRLRLLHGSLLYRDRRIEGFDAATAVEVIEHLDPSRLLAFERVVFECARPQMVIVTTPNIEFNVRFESLVAGKFRHQDHRFEWTRAEFRAWAEGLCERFSYDVVFEPVGEDDPDVGPPTQMGVFTRRG